MCVDLHTHSLHSDGTASIRELIEQAAHLKLAGFAITDHDTIDGQEQAVLLAEEYETPLITGLEVSAVHDDFSVHVLAYGFDYGDRELRAWLGQLQEGRIRRNQTIMEKLQKLGLDIHSSELASIAGLDQTGRPHIAQLLLRKNIVSSLDQAFSLYLGRDKVAYAPRFTYSVRDTIAAIHRAGGLAVLAHPGLLDHSMKRQPPLIAELAAQGLDGIEVYYPGHSPKIIRHLEQLALQYDLVMTGGSDYHGGNRPGSQLAGPGRFCPPDSIMEALLAAGRKKYAIPCIPSSH